MNERPTLTTMVTALRREADDVLSVELTAVGSIELPAWGPGDHIDVHLQPTLVRQYSLCGNPLDSSRYLIAVKRESASRGGSEYVHSVLRTGDYIEISSPRTKFELLPSTHPPILLAAGIGITPLASMARYLNSASRPFVLHYFTRSESSVVFNRDWATEALSGSVKLHIGLPRADTLGAIEKIALDSDRRTHIYVCGPPGFIEAALDIFDRYEFDSEAVHFERFSADVPILRPASDSGSFVVKAARSGIDIDVSENESIAEALGRHGVEVPTSCEAGICGTCLSDVLSGTPEHRDDYLTDDEKESGLQMCVCVSRCLAGPLVLDL